MLSDLELRLTQDTGTQLRRRLRRWSGVGQHPRHLAERLDVGAAGRTLGEMRLKRGALRDGEGVEGERRGELPVAVVVGHGPSLESS